MYQSVYVLIIMGAETFVLTILVELELMGESKAETWDFVCGVILCATWVIVILGHHIYIALRMYCFRDYRSLRNFKHSLKIFRHDLCK